ncbi:cytochrome [alpha proteobacterium AAP81b]|nr:cytochrome [alpha proteobacterium AAP81b]
MNAPALNLVPADLPSPGYAELAHLPGVEPTRIRLFKTIAFLKDPLGKSQAMLDAYGRVFRTQNFDGWGVSLVGPEANELVMFNRDRIFSSDLGWTPVLENLFPNGLMLMDGDRHRTHRKTLSVAFKPEPMRHYLAHMSAGIDRGIAGWPGTAFKFYPAIKALTLDLAAASFLGVPWGPEAGRINKAFADMVAASVAVVRKPLPFTAMKRGVAGRAYMSAYFAREIPGRRGKTGDDIFTQVCNAENDAGELLTTQEIIDHMNFLMMAAHDTTTSSITSVVHFLGLHQDWQDRAREEVRGIRTRLGGGPLTPESLAEFEIVEMIFKESLRLIPPVPSMPRRALRDFVFMNHAIPAGTRIGINPMLTHRLPDIWPDPERFDPTRFTADNIRTRHKYAWVPFGGGPHMCLGLHFAYMQVKAFFYTLLADHRIVHDPAYRQEFSMFPIPKPRDGLPLRVEKA